MRIDPDRLAQHEPVLAGVLTDFRDVIIDPLDVLIFRDADLSKCRFLDTDVRETEFAGVIWPKIGRRQIVYDESRIQGLEPFLLIRIERLYRQLKQNYEDRRDHERVSDFHYGEKEMRRKNPDTPLGQRFFLTLYWALTGYGERYLRPLVSAALLLVISTLLYLLLGLFPKGGWVPLELGSVVNWGRGFHYSFRVMALLKPEDFVPSEVGQWVNTIQSILGPILFGLFALALRQRLRR